MVKIIRILSLLFTASLCFFQLTFASIRCNVKEGEPEESIQKTFVLQMPISKEALTQMNPFNDKHGPNPQPGRHHKGVDFVAPLGTPIFAAYDGVVKLAKNEGNGYGLRIIIDHENGMTTTYSHLQKSLVKVGQEVKVGEKIGLCGSTGRSTGPHLHFEVLRNDTALDPKLFFVGELKGVVVRKEPLAEGPFTVVIDAGHGGHDFGAQGHGLDEKTISLELALMLKSLLEKESVNVVLTRNSDEYLDLKSRTDEVSKVKNGVYITLHAATNKVDQFGAKLYVPATEDERQINSLKLAELMSSNLSQSGVQVETMQQANYFVLKYSTLPAVLFEAGNLNNEQDAINLTSADYLRQMAENLAKGILSYMQ